MIINETFNLYNSSFRVVTWRIELFNIAQEKQILAPDTPDEEIMHMNPQMVNPSQLPLDSIEDSMLLEQFKPLISYLAITY